MINKIKNLYKNNSDLIVKKINDEYHVVYFESICSTDRVNDFISRPLLYNETISAPNIKKIKFDEVQFYLNSAFAIIIKNNKIFAAAEVRANLSRSISTPETEPSINGPKDAFTENIQLNLGLIKRRIKTKDLIIIDETIGTDTCIKTQIMYLKNKIKNNDLNNVIKKISKIKNNNIIDSSDISNQIESFLKSDFPTIILSERPDEASNALLEGKIVLIVDNSPYALITPSYFTDFINPVVDKYTKGNSTNFIKLIRYMALVITLVIPAFYVATINYNQEAIPTSLLIHLMTQREGVPFPSALEALIMLIIYEMLHESDLRFPSKYGSTISILGALILGEAAVSAGIVSPIMIITVAMCFISSIIFKNPNFNNALRLYRFLFLFGASTLGLFGILIVFLYMLTKLCSTYTNNKAYTIPVSPYRRKYFKNYIWKKGKKLWK